MTDPNVFLNPDESEQFSHDVDALLRSGPLADDQISSAEYSEMLSLAEAMVHTDFSDESGIRQQLRAELLSSYGKGNQKMTTRTANRVVQLGAAAAIALVVAVAGILAVPPARAAAADLIAQLLGLAISDEPTVAEQIVTAEANPAVTPPSIDGSGLAVPTPNYTDHSYIMPVNEAEAMLGGKLLQPGFVPGGYSLTLRFGGINVDGVRGVTSTYNTPNSEYALIIDQVPSGPERILELGAAETTTVIVRGVEALYAESVPLGWINQYLNYDASSGQVIVDQTPEGYALWELNVLLWEENGMILRIMADNLPMEALLQVAESLTAQ